jgi:signal transduction histidine kinase
VLALSSTHMPFDEDSNRILVEVARRAAVFVENARLRQAEHRALQMRDEVLGIVAHDLGNLLAAIRLQIGALRPPAGHLERRAARPAEAIHRASKRMQRIIDDLLDVTQLDAGHLVLSRAHHRPQDILAEAIAGHAGACSAQSITLLHEVQAELPEVVADGARVLQVLENLIGNALKFTKTGSIKLGAERRGDEVLFWVSDTGSGISEEDRAHLFDRFWQAAANRGTGTGLGLSIAKGIIEAHGGRLWVESTLGHGSTFYFTLPAANGAVVAASIPCTSDGDEGTPSSSGTG